MAKKKGEQDVRDDPRYHDTRKLLRKYRDVTWSLELSVQKPVPCGVWDEH